MLDEGTTAVSGQRRGFVVVRVLDLGMGRVGRVDKAEEARSLSLFLFGGERWPHIFLYVTLRFPRIRAAANY